MCIRDRAAGALEPPPPPDMGGGRSPESSAQLLDMCDVCVEQSPRSGRCVRGNAGVAAGRGDATHPIGTKKERPRDLSPVKSVKPLEADRRTAGNEFVTRIGFGFNAFDVPVGKPGKKPTQRDWRLKLSDRARADGALGSTRREGQAWTPLRSTLDGSVRRVNGPPGRARRPGGVRGEPGDSCARKTQNTRLAAVAMGPKKRKAESTGRDEMDRELYQRFRAAANSVSSMYTSSLNLQKRAFNGGARHTTEKLLQWALSQQASGEKTISASDLIQALQAELVVLEGEDASLAAAGDSPGGVAPGHPRIGPRARWGGPARTSPRSTPTRCVPHLALGSSPARGFFEKSRDVFVTLAFPFSFSRDRKLTRSSRTPRAFDANRNTNRVWARSSGRRSRSTRSLRARTPGAPARRARTSLRPGRARWMTIRDFAKGRSTSAPERSATRTNVG